MQDFFHQQYHHAFEGPQRNVMLGRYSLHNLVKFVKCVERAYITEPNHQFMVGWGSWKSSLAKKIWFRKWNYLPRMFEGFGVFSSCLARISHVWIIGGWNCDIFFSSPAMVIPKMNRPPNSEVYLCLELFLNLYENKRKTCFNKKVRVKNWR